MIELAFFAGNGLSSRLIRWFHRARWNHVGIVDHSTGLIYEAREFRGVVADSWHRRKPQCAARFRLTRELTQEERATLITFLHAQLGAGYDYGSVLRFLTRSKSKPNNGRWFCSELVAWGFNAIGRPLISAPPAEVAPEHLTWSLELEKL